MRSKTKDLSTTGYTILGLKRFGHAAKSNKKPQAIQPAVGDLAKRSEVLISADPPRVQAVKNGTDRGAPRAYSHNHHVVIVH